MITLRREMSIHRAEFLRTLAAAFEPGTFRADGNEVQVEAQPAPVSIRLSPEGERRIGSLRLPVMRLEFRFPGWTQPQVERFMNHFNRCFQRGGG